MSIQNNLWPVKYRPTEIEDYVGNPDFISKMKNWIETGDLPHLLLHSESGGTGKTTAAWLIAKKMNADVLYINASKDNGIDIIRNKIDPFISTVGFNDETKIVFLDEADFLTVNFQAALRPIMEEQQSTVRFILTANQVEKIIGPIRSSRCVSIEINTPPPVVTLTRLEKILNLENVVYDRKEVAQVVKDFYPDQRAMLMFLQDNSKTGTFVKPEKVKTSVFSDSIIELLKSGKSAKDIFINVREIVSENRIKHFEPIFRKLYEHVDDYAKPGTVGSIILTIAEAQFKDVQVADKEINFMALIVNILNIIK